MTKVTSTRALPRKGYLMDFSTAWERRLTNISEEKKDVQLRINYGGGSTATMVTSLYQKDTEKVKEILFTAWKTLCKEHTGLEYSIDRIIVEDVDISWVKCGKGKTSRLTA